MELVTQNISIRLATVDDLPEILALQQQWEGEAITYGFSAGSIQDLLASLAATLLVAETAGAIVGFIAASPHVSEGMAVIPAGEQYLEIDDVYVLPAHRGHGIGRTLVDAVLARAHAQGIKHQLVYSATKDIRRMLHFYEECGFASWYIQMYRTA